jgi:hypothetical protein
VGTTFSALKLWLSNHFFRMTFLSCCNGELRSTPLRSISSPPFSLSLLFGMTVSRLVRASDALITKGDSIGRALFPHHDQRPVHFAVFFCIRAANSSSSSPLRSEAAPASK